MSAFNAVDQIKASGEGLQRLLGRRPAADSRDYHMRSALGVGPAAPAAMPVRRSWRTGPILNQGLVECPLQNTTHPYCKEHGFCVGAGTKQFLMSEPLRTMTGPQLLDIYHTAQLLDEWPGEDYSGTSVRAGMKTLQKLGHIVSYAAPQTPAELEQWLSTRGCAVIGIDWTEEMFTPDAKGFITPGSTVIGGHCLCVSMIDRSGSQPIYGGPNSWGRGWGLQGRWRMTAASLYKLLFQQGGECFMAEEVRVARG